MELVIRDLILDLKRIFSLELETKVREVFTVSREGYYYVKLGHDPKGTWKGALRIYAN